MQHTAAQDDLDLAPDDPRPRLVDATARRTRVLVVDDHPVVRAGLAAILAGTPGYEVAGAAGTAQEALDQLARTRADVVVLDVRLGPASGIELCRTLRQRFPALRVVLWTSFPTDDLALAAARAGAHGFLAKDAEPGLLREAIGAVLAGGAFVRSTRPARAKGRRPRGPYGLTAQEMRVLNLLPRGLTNREIGRELGVSDETVKTHLSSAMRKLNVAGRVQATAAVVQGCLR